MAGSEGDGLERVVADINTVDNITIDAIGDGVVVRGAGWEREGWDRRGSGQRDGVSGDVVVVVIGNGDEDVLNTGWDDDGEGDLVGETEVIGEGASFGVSIR